MSNAPTYPIKREKAGRVTCTVACTAAQTAVAEEEAIQALGAHVNIHGFRPGKAPIDMLKEKLKPEEILDGTIRALLPALLEAILTEHQLHPIIPPKVDVEKTDPLTLKISFFEKPEVAVKGSSKITVKTEEPKIEEKDVERLVDYVRKQHQTSAVKDGPAEKDDRVTMDFWGNTLDGKEVEGTRTTGHQVIIGSKVLLPGFEDQLIGMKAGDKKDFTLTFPEKHQAEHLRNTPVAFHVTVTQVEKITLPELTDAFVKQHLQADTVDAFKQQIRESMAEQEKAAMRRKHEEDALEQIRAATKVELAPELVDDELRSLLEDLEEHLKQRQMSFREWLEQNKKKPEEAQKELREQAEKRLTLRFGLAHLVDERDVQVTDEEMSGIIEEFLGPLSGDEREKIEPSYQKGQRAYEQLKWQKRVEKLLADIIKH